MIIWFSFFCSSRWNDWIRKWIFWVRSVRQKLIKKIFHCFLIFCGIPFLRTQLFCSFCWTDDRQHCVRAGVCALWVCGGVYRFQSQQFASMILQFDKSNEYAQSNGMYINVIKNGNWYVLLGHFNCELSFISYFPHRLTIDFRFRHNHISNAPLFYEIIKRNKCQTKCK